MDVTCRDKMEKSWHERMVLAYREKMEKGSSERNVVCASEVVKNPEIPEANRTCTPTISSSSAAVESQRNHRGLNVVYQRPFAYSL
jgi:hypothetical protein